MFRKRRTQPFRGQKKVCCGARRPGRELPPTPALRWHMKDEHVKDAAQDVAEELELELELELIQSHMAQKRTS